MKVFTYKNKLQLHLTILVFSVFVMLVFMEKPFEELTFENINRVGFFISSKIEASLKKTPPRWGFSRHSTVGYPCHHTGETLVSES